MTLPGSMSTDTQRRYGRFRLDRISEAGQSISLSVVITPKVLPAFSPQDETMNQSSLPGTLCDSIPIFTESFRKGALMSKADSFMCPWAIFHKCQSTSEG